MLHPIGMLSTIQFNRQHPLDTGKVENESFRLMLAPELHAELMIAQA